MEQIAKAQTNLTATETDFKNSETVSDKQKEALQSYKTNLLIAQGALAEMTGTHLGQFPTNEELRSEVRKSIKTTLSFLPDGLKIYVKDATIKSYIDDSNSKLTIGEE
jgi:outer membrane protein TolC